MIFKRDTKSVSLVYELHDLEHALAAIGHLAGSVQEAPDLLEARRTVWALESVATLARQRVRLLTQAINGDLDPALLHRPGNAGPSGAEQDFELPLWSDSKTSKRAKRGR